jgi:hypothetical protein
MEHLSPQGLTYTSSNASSGHHPDHHEAISLHRTRSRARGQKLAANSPSWRFLIGGGLWASPRHKRRACGPGKARGGGAAKGERRARFGGKMKSILADPDSLLEPGLTPHHAHYPKRSHSNTNAARAPGQKKQQRRPPGASPSPSRGSRAETSRSIRTNMHTKWVKKLNGLATVPVALSLAWSHGRLTKNTYH